MDKHTAVDDKKANNQKVVKAKLSDLGGAQGQKEKTGDSGAKGKGFKEEIKQSGKKDKQDGNKGTDGKIQIVPYQPLKSTFVGMKAPENIEYIKVSSSGSKR